MDVLDSTRELGRKLQAIKSPLLNVAISTACTHTIYKPQKGYSSVQTICIDFMSNDSRWSVATSPRNWIPRQNSWPPPKLDGWTRCRVEICRFTTWWLIPFSKWVITCYNSSHKWTSRVNPLITGVISHLLSGMIHQIPSHFFSLGRWVISENLACGYLWLIWTWHSSCVWPMPKITQKSRICPRLVFSFFFFGDT